MENEQQAVWYSIKSGAHLTVRQLLRTLEYVKRNSQQKQITAEKISREAERASREAPGEKDMEFMTSTGKTLSKETLSEEVNLDRVRNVLNDYKVQFAFKPIENGNELIFHTKDKQLFSEYLSKAVKDLIDNPEKMTGASLDKKVKEAEVKQGAIKDVKSAEKTDELVKKAAETGKEAVKNVAEKASEMVL